MEATSGRWVISSTFKPTMQPSSAPPVVDPLGRYRHYATAQAAGELDPAFKTLSVWELRNVVNGDEPDAFLTWGREMLRNYRPDHVLNPDYGWRYSRAVNTDVRYGSQNVKDLNPLQFYPPARPSFSASCLAR